MHFSALIQRTEKAVNWAKTETSEICRIVLTRMIMQDRLNVSGNEREYLAIDDLLDEILKQTERS